MNWPAGTSPAGQAEKLGLSVVGTRALARCVLAFFLLSIFAAIASPLVNPQALHVICTGQGPAMVVEVDEDGEHVASRRQAENGPCVTILTRQPAETSAPPIPGNVQPDKAWRLAPAVRVTGNDGAPLPARGPPSAAVL